MKQMKIESIQMIQRLNIENFNEIYSKILMIDSKFRELLSHSDYTYGDYTCRNSKEMITTINHDAFIFHEESFRYIFLLDGKYSLRCQIE